MRQNGGIAIATASTGVSSQLLHGGVTTHSAFRLTLHPGDDVNSNLNARSDMARMLKEDCKLVVVDEATMLHKHLLAQLDATLRDVRSSNVLFGGLSVVLAGDFASRPQ